MTVDRRSIRGIMFVSDSQWFFVGDNGDLRRGVGATNAGESENQKDPKQLHVEQPGIFIG
jgi:hypothetical protein